MGTFCSRPQVSSSSLPVAEGDAGGNLMDSDGQVIEHYAKLQRLGEGSYAKVILVRDTNDGILYAAKVYSKQRLKKLRTRATSSAWDDVVRELSILRRIRHPHVVELIEVLDKPNDDKLYAIMEYVSGGAVISGCGMGLPESLCRLYMRDAVCGLQFLHACGVIHMDIKPENLMLTEDGRVKVGDLGLGRVVFNGQKNEDVCSTTYGTPYFAPPESCSGQSEYSGFAADAWAMGVTCYVLLFGCYPFEGSTAYEVYENIARLPIKIAPNVSASAKDFLLKLLDKDPKSRLTLVQAMDHPFLTQEGSLQPLVPQEFSTKELCALWEIDAQVVKMGSTVGVGGNLINAMSNFPHLHAEVG